MSLRLRIWRPLRERLGLNEPLLVQYGIYMGSVLQGDLGESLKFPEQRAGAVMARLPATIYLAGVSLALALAIGIPWGCERH